MSLPAQRGSRGWPLCALWLVVGCHPQPPPQVQAQRVAQAHEPGLLMDRARAFAGVGDFARAEQYLGLALQHGAGEQQVLPLLLEVCVRDQRYRDAAQYVDDHLRRRPGAYRLRLVLAGLYAALGELQAAREQLERALQKQPDNAHAHYALAVLLRDGAGDLGRADAHFREYLRLSPHGPHAEEASGSLLQRLP